MSFAGHVTGGKAEEILWVVKHEVMASLGEVPVVEVLDMRKAEVAHLTFQRALRSTYKDN